MNDFIRKRWPTAFADALLAMGEKQAQASQLLWKCLGGGSGHLQDVIIE